MEKIEYLKQLKNHIGQAARLMVEHKDFGPRLERLADIEHEIESEIDKIEDSKLTMDDVE